jgi:hypothetical protein
MNSRFLMAAVATSLLLAHVAIAPPASANGAGAFVGGMITGKVLDNMNRRTEAEEHQAYDQPQPVQQAAPAAASAPRQQSAEERLAQLDKLAAGGYITKDEYKTKRQAILDSM